MEAVTEAVVLCQFLPNIDYEKTFTMLKANPGRISSVYLKFIWEMPILEFLAYFFSQKYIDTAKYDLVLSLIRRPELNEHNRAGTERGKRSGEREKFIDHIHDVFFA
jgi:hypothetical protein